MAIIQYQPFDVFNEMNKLMQAFTNRKGDMTSNTEATQWMPLIDIAEKNNSFSIHADLPGVNKEDIQLSVENNVLTIQGERKQEKREKEHGTLHIERYFGSFTRSFTLPNNAELDKISASYNQGVLEIEIPKKQIAQNQRIAITDKKNNTQQIEGKEKNKDKEKEKVDIR